VSFTIITDVFCDSCPNWVHGCVCYKADKVKAWKKATSVGWKKVGKKLVCPDCFKRKLYDPK